MSETTVSLKRLIWRRFKRRKLGLLSVLLIVLLTFVFLCADFIAPYDHSAQHRRAPYVPPMWDRVHLWDDNGPSWPFVYGLRRVPDPERIGVFRYEEDVSQRFPLQLLVKGEPYAWWGLWPMDLHLFGTGTQANSPGQFFLLGTNQSGQDLLSQILVGGRTSLVLSFIVIASSFLLGVALGGISGYWGGWVDTALQRLVEVTMGLPRLALLLALSAAIPSKAPPMARFWAIAGVLALVSWAPLARVVRGQFLALREEDYVQAAKAIGASSTRIITRHILPNTTSYLVVAATLAVPGVLILESVLSFLGFGFNVPLVSWGLLLKQVYESFVTNLSFYPWLLLPGAFLFLTVLVFNLVGDALRDAVDPFTVDATS